MEGKNNCKDNCPKDNCSKPCCSSGQCGMANTAVVAKGVFVFLVGAILTLIAYRIVLHVLLIMVGCMLMYYGLRILRLNFITDPIDAFFKRVLGLLRC